MNRFKHYWNLGLALVVVAILATTAAIAQEVTGTIVGNVKDSTGAMLPNAKVTITNTDKNAVIRTVTTDQSGNYTAPLLPIGHYSVGVEASGFKSAVHSGITLNLGDKLTDNFDLQVGSSSETVTVQANAAQVELQSAAASGLISGTQVRELALNGRNWEQLVLLNPGVSDAGNADQIYVGAFAPQGTNLIQFSMNGGRREENNFMVDGADNMDRGSNLTLLTFPSVDAIAEFRVIRGQYDPEYGRAASGQINAITKSGTSQLHGNVYEFFRNDALNANDYFNKRTELANGKPNKPPILRYNDFGGTIGGPVYIPKLYEQTNKTFFFFSEEARRNVKYSLAHAEVPTANMQGGIFVHPVCIAFTTDSSGKKSCSTAPGSVSNTIDPASFDPIAQAYLKDIFSKYPTPNNATATDPFGFDSTLRGIFNYREEIYKIDHLFNQKFSVSGKILRDKVPTREPGGLFTNMALDNIGNTDTNSPGNNYTVRATIAPSPSFLIDTGYMYSYGAILSTPDNLMLKSASPDVASAVILPFSTVLGRVPDISFGTTGTAPASFGPYNDFNKNHTIFGNVSKIAGSHSFKFGAIFYHYQKHENAGRGNQASYTFNTLGQQTGALAFEQQWANFLTGNVGTFAQSSLDLTADIRDNQFEYYAQDTWRLKPNLTLSYGFRHSFFRQPTDALGLLENFDPKFYDPAKAPCILSSGATDVTKSPTGTLTSACNPNFDPLNGYIFAHPPAIGGSKSPFGDKLARENNTAIAPRIGIAWDPTGSGKTSIRAGFGLFYDSGIIFGNAENDIFAGIGFQNNVSFTNVTFANPTGGAPIPSTGIAGGASRAQSRIDPNYNPPYTQQWSLDIQQEFNGWILGMGYYGNNAIHLPGFIDINQPAENAYLNCNPTTPCYAGPNVPQNSNYAVSFYNNAVKDKNGNIIAAPGVYVGNGNTSLLNALRPYLGYTGSDAVRNIYTANYHSLQSQLQKQFKGNTLVNISYTWSHGLTTDQADRTTGSILPLQGHIRDNNYGPTVGDRRHVLTANFVWDLPWLKEQKGFLGHTLGGWEVSGIQTFQTGLPATVASDQNYDPTGADCLGPSPCSFRANQVGDPNSGAAHNYDTGWFNKSAFTNPALTFENCPTFPAASIPANCISIPQSTIPSQRPGAVRLPGFWRTDLSLFKNFKFTERFGGQFRLETFNTFNHTNPVCCSSFTTSSGSYDKVVSTRDPRYLELGMKLNF